jgi:aspartate/methionine/tyrosine aminotransferase
VHVKKTTMHENNFSPAGKNQIRFAGQILSVQAVTIAEFVNYRAHYHFRFCIPASDTRHIKTALRRSMNICH